MSLTLIHENFRGKHYFTGQKTYHLISRAQNEERVNEKE